MELNISTGCSLHPEKSFPILVWVCMHVALMNSMHSHIQQEGFLAYFARLLFPEGWKTEGIWPGTKIFLSFPGGHPNGKQIYISAIVSLPLVEVIASKIVQGWVSPGPQWLTEEKTLFGDTNRVVCFHSMYHLSLNQWPAMWLKSWRTDQLCDPLYISHLSAAFNVAMINIQPLHAAPQTCSANIVQCSDTKCYFIAGSIFCAFKNIFVAYLFSCTHLFVYESMPLCICTYAFQV